MKAITFLIFLLSGNLSIYNKANFSLPNRTKYSLDSLPNSILIINSFDAMSVKARNTKKELLRELTDSLKSYLAESVEKQTRDKTIVTADILSDADNPDSLVFSLIEQKNATKAILILAGDVYFKETGVEETTNFDVKTKNMVSYDLCATNRYYLYSKDTILQKSIVENCEFFTKRNAGGGHFVIGVGPNIVAKRKYAFGIIAKNAEKYISEISMQLSQ